MTRKQKLTKLEALQKKAKALQDKEDELVAQALEITKEADPDGYTFDFIMNNYGTAEELLKRFEKHG